MKTYKIVYTEARIHVFYVDAESERDAEEKFCELGNNGELDFSDGEVYDSQIESIEEMEG